MNFSVGKAKCYNKKCYLCTWVGLQMLWWQGEAIFRELARCRASLIPGIHGTLIFFVLVFGWFVCLSVGVALGILELDRLASNSEIHLPVF